ncbi:MAG: PAS domain S-box protein [Acidobacteria bacterium]|nr:PAS domain S-box protein [Acidobacteriota bacterium]
MVSGTDTDAREAQDAVEAFASRLFSFLSTVGTGATEAERVALITTNLSSVVHSPLAGVALVDRAGQWTVRLEIRGQPVEVDSALAEQLEPLYRLVSGGQPIVVATREGGTSAPAVPPALEKLRVRRLAVVTLVSSGGQLGVLFAGREAGRPFAAGEELALLAVAQQAAVGIENLRLHDALGRRAPSPDRQSALILNAAGAGVLAVDPEGVTTFVNPAAARRLGWHAGDLIGQPMHSVLHHTHADGFPFSPDECPITAAFMDGQTHEVRDDVFWRQDGTSLPVEYIAAPMEEDGAVVGAVEVFLDATARPQAGATLQSALEDVRALTRQLDALAGGAPDAVGPARQGILTDAELQAAHDDNLRAALDSTGWKIYGPGGTAERLGMRPTTLAARMKKAGLIRLGASRPGGAVRLPRGDDPLP